jgi:obg-like ATPase 1
LQNLLEFLKSGKDVRTGTWKAEEIDWINPLFLLSAKPIVFLLNLTESDYKRRKNKWLGKVKTWVDEHAPGSVMIPVCVPVESEAAALPTEARAAFWAEKSLQSSLPKIIRTGYQCLRLINFFTCGADEVRCWTIRVGIFYFRFLGFPNFNIVIL